MGTSNTTSTTRSTRCISAAYAGRIDELLRAVDASAAVADVIGQTETFFATMNLRSKTETIGNAFKPLNEAMKPEPLNYAGVFVAAAQTGSVHDSQAHVHAIVRTTPEGALQLSDAIRTRNDAVPRSYNIQKTDEGRGGVAGTVGYMAGRSNLGRAGSRVIQSKAVKIGKTERICQVFDGASETSGAGRVTGPIPSTRSRPTSNAQSVQPSGQRSDDATLAEVGGQPTIMGGSAASAGGRDETTLSVATATPHLRLVVSNDLLGTNYVDQGTLDQYDGGIIPVRVARAIRLKLQSLGWRQEDLAGSIGVSRPQMVNALVGRFGLSGWPVHRLKSWMADPNPTRPEPSRKPQVRRPERQRNQGDPRQLDLVDYIASLPIAA